MRKILTSVFVIALAAGAAYAGTNAFFSDVETSTGNRLETGSIDLLVDSQSHYAGLVCNAEGVWQVENDVTTREDLIGKPCSGTWEQTNLNELTNSAFFNFSDLKPGDSGENTISLHVESNDAYMCAVIDNMQDNDLGLTEPEQEAGDSTDGLYAGELSPELHFFAWADDNEAAPGNNIWEEGEEPLFSNQYGPASDVLDGVVYPMYIPEGLTFAGGATHYIGMYWCYGTISTDDHILSCDGSPVGNMSQTDQLVADMSFYVEQARNNDNFSCDGVQVNSAHRLVLENKNPNNWEEVYTNDNKSGVLSWDGDGVFTFTATGLTEGIEYKLIYAPDPWPQGVDSEDTVLGTGTVASGDLTITGDLDNLGYNLPHLHDANYPTGAKIWLVLSADHNGKQMTAWHPSDYLFETSLIHY